MGRNIKYILETESRRQEIYIKLKEFNFQQFTKISPYINISQEYKTPFSEVV